MAAKLRPAAIALAFAYSILAFVIPAAVFWAVGAVVLVVVALSMYASMQADEPRFGAASLAMAGAFLALGYIASGPLSSGLLYLGAYGILIAALTILPGSLNQPIVEPEFSGPAPLPFSSIGIDDNSPDADERFIRVVEDLKRQIHDLERGSQGELVRLRDELDELKASSGKPSADIKRLEDNLAAKMLEIKDALNLENKLALEKLAATLRESSGLPPNVLSGLLAKATHPQASPIKITHLRNAECTKGFNRALDSAQTELDIVSPWMTRGVVSDALVARFEAFLKKGGTLRINYGYNDNSDSRREDESDRSAKKLRDKLSKYGKRFEVNKVNTHTKLVICDDKFYMIGSFNWLSFKGNFDPDTRDESADLIEAPDTIADLRASYFPSTAPTP